MSELIVFLALKSKLCTKGLGELIGRENNSFDSNLHNRSERKPALLSTCNATVCYYLCWARMGLAGFHHFVCWRSNQKVCWHQETANTHLPSEFFLLCLGKKLIQLYLDIRRCVSQRAIGLGHWDVLHWAEGHLIEVALHIWLGMWKQAFRIL